MKNTADVTGGKPIAVLLQSISGLRAINPLVTFYDIHGGKRVAILLFCPGHHTRYNNKPYIFYMRNKPYISRGKRLFGLNDI
jgi:hypothetical protein